MPCERVSSGILRQRRPRSACASAQSNQGLRCPLLESLDAIEWRAKARMIPFARERWCESAHCACSKHVFATIGYSRKDWWHGAGSDQISLIRTFPITISGFIGDYVWKILLTLHNRTDWPQKTAETQIRRQSTSVKCVPSRKHAYIILTPLTTPPPPSLLYSKTWV